jgi:hypothetical protein
MAGLVFEFVSIYWFLLICYCEPLRLADIPFQITKINAGTYLPLAKFTNRMNFEELVKNSSGEMIEKLLTDVLGKDAVEVRFEFEDNDQWSVITMHIYEEDKEISIRLHANDRYDLYFGYYDDEDEFHEIIKELSPEEKLMIPKGLQKVMTKVLSDEQGMRLPGNFLSK